MYRFTLSGFHRTDEIHNGEVRLDDRSKFTCYIIVVIQEAASLRYKPTRINLTHASLNSVSRMIHCFCYVKILLDDYTLFSPKLERFVPSTSPLV